MLLKNTNEGGVGLGVAGHGPIRFEPGEVKDVPDAVLAKAKLDPANAALLAEGGPLVEVTGNPHARPGSPALTNPSGSPEDIAKINAAAEKARAEAEQREKDEAAKAELERAAAEQKAKDEAAAKAAVEAKPESKAESKKGAGTK